MRNEELKNKVYEELKRYLLNDIFSNTDFTITNYFVFGLGQFGDKDYYIDLNNLDDEIIILSILYPFIKNGISYDVTVIREVISFNNLIDYNAYILNLEEQIYRRLKNFNHS